MWLGLTGKHLKGLRVGGTKIKYEPSHNSAVWQRRGLRILWEAAAEYKPETWLHDPQLVTGRLKTMAKLDENAAYLRWFVGVPGGVSAVQWHVPGDFEVSVAYKQCSTIRVQRLDCNKWI